MDTDYVNAFIKKQSELIMELINLKIRLEITNESLTVNLAAANVKIAQLEKAAEKKTKA